MTLMWEARAAAGQTDALRAWVLQHAAPGAQVYGNATHVVVIDESDGRMPEPPADLLARPVHAWTFDRVR